jgi:NAD(P)-dependent dehydrogenase (short-subunit alcohol dehydrogenase family)
MAREGADVSILYLPEEEEDAKFTIKQIEKAGRKGHGLQYDLTEEGSCKAAIDEHIKVFGKINVLVNNASMQVSCEDHREIDIATVNKTFQTNIIQMMALSKYALQHMKRGDNIVNCASVLGYMGDPTKVDYSSTKGAIVTFTRALAKQQAPRGIRVNAVAPGIMYVSPTFSTPLPIYSQHTNNSSQLDSPPTRHSQRPCRRHEECRRRHVPYEQNWHACGDCYCVHPVGIAFGIVLHRRVHPRHWWN